MAGHCNWDRGVPRSNHLHVGETTQVVARRGWGFAVAEAPRGPGAEEASHRASAPQDLGTAFDAAGIDATPEVQGLFRYAAALQAERRSTRVADRDGVTRSVLLLVLLERASDVASLLKEHGLSAAAWRQQLDVTDAMERRARSTERSVARVELEPELLEALAAHLSPKLEEVRPLDLAVAVLRSARPPTGGVLGRRLDALGFDIASSVESIAEPHVHTSTPDTVSTVDPQEFSASVRQLRHRFGPATQVTAAQMAQSLQPGHPGYAGGMFGDVPLRPDVGRQRGVDEWLADVRASYDPDRLRATRHHVLDGELLLVALADLDQDLADDLNRAGILEVLRRDVELLPRRPTSDRTEWSPDTPAVEDLLGRKALARTLADRVRRLAEEDSRSMGSFLVHVDGPWGAGKSSLFGFLATDLSKGEPSFLVVPVNAWREQRVGVQWWTLLSALQRQILRETSGRQQIRFRLEVLSDRVRAAWIPVAVTLLVLFSISVAVLSGLDLRTGGELADPVLKILSLLSVVSAGLLAAARYLVPGSKRTAEALIENSDNPMRRVGELFARTLERSPKPVVFLIDDLDRCDADYVVEFLEVVQTLVRDAPLLLDDRRTRAGTVRRRRASGPYVFVAADGHWIRSSYERHFESFGRTIVPGRPLGYLFLEKIFQLHVVLPAVTAAARNAYVRNLLTPRSAQPPRDVEDVARIRAAEQAVREAQTEAEVVSAGRVASDIEDPEERMRLLGAAAVRFSERGIEDRPDHDLARFIPLLDPNPRSMKLFVNTYGVLRSLRTLEEVFVPSEALALWAVVEIRWPALADHLRGHPEAVEEWRTGAGFPADLGDLLRDKDVGRVLDDPGWGRLTAERLRECAGAP
jgi:hypothetical protein